jgi:hypothetical protein
MGRILQGPPYLVLDVLSMMKVTQDPNGINSIASASDLVSDYQSRKENDLQILVPRKEFIQSQESGGMVMASMWNKGTELGMKKFTEPIKMLQLMQQLLTSLASQLICLNLF